jgi:uncharacterized protein YcbX
MNRFRPNLVVDGVAPYAEDGWRSVRVGGVTSGEPEAVLTAARSRRPTRRRGSAGSSPSAPSRGYRRAPDGEVAFGVNVGFEAPGVLRVGDMVEVEPGTA